MIMYEGLYFVCPECFQILEEIITVCSLTKNFNLKPDGSESDVEINDEEFLYYTCPVCGEEIENMSFNGFRNFLIEIRNNTIVWIAEMTPLQAKDIEELAKEYNLRISANVAKRHKLKTAYGIRY